MTRIAFISDIHSNYFALKAVLEDIKERNVDTVYCLGDIVGYHTFPNETIELLKQEGVISILGNHDIDVINKKFNESKELDIFKWTYDELSEENLKYLQKLPRYLDLEIEGHSVYICHGSPNSISEYLREGDEISNQVMASYDGDLLICAHTHMPYTKSYEENIIVNTGSVGKPKIGRPNSTYQLLEIDDKDILAEIIEIEYDYSEIADHVESKGFIKYAEALRTGIA